MMFRDMVESILKVVKSGRIEYVDWPTNYENLETGDFEVSIEKLKNDTFQLKTTIYVFVLEGVLTVLFSFYRKISNIEPHMSKNLLVVGQTPPPYGGQAMIIKRILEMQYDSVHIYHVRMAFSKEMSKKLGKFEIKKMFHLVEVIIKIYYYRFKYKTDILYYPPSGPNKVPVYRDMMVLLCTRWLFKRTIFQFLAGGVADFFTRGNHIERYLFKKSFFYPDVSLRPSEFSPPDGEKLFAKKEFIIPWGNEDNFVASPRNHNAGITILFVGVLVESKGILVLLEACKLLIIKKYEIKAEILGAFSSEEIKRTINAFIIENNLLNVVNFNGVKTGEQYYTYFTNADIFCFPSFFESENLPVVLIDAMKFRLPVVTTNWRGIPEMVRDGVNGFLVEPRGYLEVAEKLEI